MNNPVRALVQGRHEAALMERFGGRVEGGRVLEIGCGRGVGTEIIFERFGAREVHAFDLDPDMIERARRRLAIPRSAYGCLWAMRSRLTQRMLLMMRYSTSESSTTCRRGSKPSRKSRGCSNPAAVSSLKKSRSKHLTGGSIGRF